MSTSGGMGTGRAGEGECCDSDCSLEGNWGGASPRAAGAAAPVSLPCQSSNNSTEPLGELTPYQRKNAYSLAENLESLVECFGEEKIGFLTLTFPKNLTLKEANRRFNSLASHCLDSWFKAWVCVREFTAGGRPHFHLVVACHEDIRAGFDFAAYMIMARLSSNPSRRRKNAARIKRLSRCLNPSPYLANLWRELRRVLPKYQFGRHELIPIRKSGAALSRYVGGYIRKSMEFRPIEAKGARLVTYSKKFPRRVVGHAWAWNTDGARVWRMKTALFAKLHGITDHENGLKDAFGDKWAYWFRDVIASLNVFPLGLDCETSLAAVQTMDLERLQTSIAERGEAAFTSLHLYPPRLPEVDGKTLIPSARLRPIFAFHLQFWSATPDEVVASASSTVSRSARLSLRKLSAHWSRDAVRASLAAPELSSQLYLPLVVPYGARPLAIHET